MFGRGELFRRHTGNLDLIVHMHNGIETTLLPVEGPLLQLQLDRKDQLLAQGICGGSHKLQPPQAAPKPGGAGEKKGAGASVGKGATKKAGLNSTGMKNAPGRASSAPGGEGRQRHATAGN